MGRHQVNSLNCLGSQISFPWLIQVKSYLSLPLLLALLLIFCWLWFLKPCEIFSLSQAGCPHFAKASASCTPCFHAEKLMCRSRAELKPTNIVGQLRTANPNLIWTFTTRSPPTEAKTFSGKIAICTSPEEGQGRSQPDTGELQLKWRTKRSKRSNSLPPVSLSSRWQHSQPLERRGRTVLHHRASTQPTAEEITASRIFFFFCVQN